ncbi:MAG TPA: hypothetical protein VGZ73_12150 [Bryobacteraceae bacterium]|nr:hypothetical protein [Bryobacteraceae bacterium]
MKKLSAKTAPLMTLFLAGFGAAAGASGPIASPASLTFSYISGSGTAVKPQTVTVTLPASMSSQQLYVTANSVEGWLVVSPLSGSSPLVLTVSANPTTLDPGSHPGTITIDTKTPPSNNAALVPVTFVITAAAPTLQVKCTACTNYAITLSPYVTGGALPASFSLLVASSGDAIPFSVAAANAATKGGTGTSKTPVWLRVSQGSPPTPNLTTSGVALSGSFIQIDVTVDATVLATLDPVSSPFSGTITVSPTKSGSSSGTSASPTVVAVTLQVVPGAPGGLLQQCQPQGQTPPTVRCIAIFPTHLPAVLNGMTAADPAIVTILGDNFFAPGITSVSIDSQAGAPAALTPPNLVWISRAIMQVTIPSTFLNAVGVTRSLIVQNGSQQSVSATLTVDDPTLPTITSVVSAASYLSSLPASATDYPHVSPREIISIFGRNLGPALTPVTPVLASSSSDPTDPTAPKVYPTGPPGPLPVAVDFLVGTSPTQSIYHAPIIMYSPTQINCVVPYEVDGTISPVYVQVTYNGATTASPFQVTPMSSHPGIFSSGGAGLGQAAVLNYNSSTNSYTVNSSGAAALRSSAIVIYATGMGDLQAGNGGPLQDGLVAPMTAVKLAAMNPDPLNPNVSSPVNVSIDGQPAVVTYAGTSPGAVAGLVQINAIVPLAAKASNTAPISISIGTGPASQSGVWLAVK